MPSLSKNNIYEEIAEARETSEKNKARRGISQQQQQQLQQMTSPCAGLIIPCPKAKAAALL